jgi:hypothetical protein
MRLRFVRPLKSIVGPVSNDEINDFVVLSGLNGAGKSNLLEAIQTGAITVDDIVQPQPAKENSPIRLFRLGHLRPARDQNNHPTIANYYYTWRTYPIQIEQIIERLARSGRKAEPGSDELETAVVEGLTQAGLSSEVLRGMTSLMGKRLIDFTSADFEASAPLLPGKHNLFAMSISQVFLSYQARFERNELAQARSDRGRPGGEAALTDADFMSRYGAPPWDVLNEILQSVGLGYHLTRPEVGRDHIPFDVRLIDNETQVAIDLSQLSSGETTLMTIAMSLYAGSQFRGEIELPKVLLLDEPDASLHPAMTRELIRVVDDIFHKRFGVKVILATHAPSTVALAPEEALYTIRRTGDPRLRPAASRDEALSALMVGLPTLSVRNNSRRQVFVESDDDGSCYNELYRLLKDKLDSPFSLDFIASGKGGQGNNDAVIRLVRSLRESGNIVQGLIDRDDRQGAPEGIEYVRSRRTLENLILDPFLVALFLLRERIVPSETIAGAAVTHFDLDNNNVQAMCDYVTGRVRQPGDDQSEERVDYLSGFEVRVPKFYLEINGHELERRILGAFPALRRYGGLKIKIITYVLSDRPEYVPMDVVELFERLGKVIGQPAT